jgi:hypothetical protein
VSIRLGYADTDFDYSELTKIDSYDSFYSLISDTVNNKKPDLIFAIRGYNNEKYNLGNVLFQINKEVLSEKGYCAKIVQKQVIDTNPAIMQIYFTYPKSNGNYSPEEDRDKLILKNVKEWYTAVKNVISNCGDSLLFDPTYSSDIGNVIEKVTEINPEVGAYLDNVFREAKSRILQEVYKN